MAIVLHNYSNYDKLFTMLNNINTTLQYLKALNLSTDEAKLYLELLKGPRSHLELSRSTGINRTKVYRLADQLERRSLVSTQTDDQGTRLIAADPATLEIAIITEEEKLSSQRMAFKQLLPTLTQLRTSGGKTTESFSVQTYEGVEGFKQMLWHELKANNEVVIFGSGTIEDLVPSVRWAERHRRQTAEAGYKIREILNPGKKKEQFTKNTDFMARYQKRYLPAGEIPLDHQVVIYNDTVATFCWRGNQKVGFEVINKAYNQMMKQIFEHYWQLATSQP